MRTTIAILTILLATPLALPAGAADASLPALPGEVRATSVASSPAAFLTFAGSAAPDYTIFIEPTWSATIETEGSRHTLSLENARGELVGEFVVRSDAAPTLSLGIAERAFQSDAIPYVPPESILPDVPDVEPGEPISIPLAYSIANCNANQVCTQTRRDEGCSQCFHHWGRMTWPNPSNIYKMDACDNNAGCTNLAIINTASFWESGWLCSAHFRTPFTFSNTAWTRITLGSTTLSADGGLSYSLSRMC